MMELVKGTDRVWFTYLPKTDEVYIFQTETIKSNTNKVWENKMSAKMWASISSHLDEIIATGEHLTPSGDFDDDLEEMSEDAELERKEYLLGIGNLNRLKKAELQAILATVTGEEPDDSILADELRATIAELIADVKDA